MKSALLVVAAFVAAPLLGGALQEYGRHFAAYTIREAPRLALRCAMLLAALGARLAPHEGRAERAEEYAAHLMERDQDRTWRVIRDGFGFVIAGMQEPGRRRAPARPREAIDVRTPLRRAIALTGLTATVVVSGSIAVADGARMPNADLSIVSELPEVPPTVIDVDNTKPAEVQARRSNITRPQLKAIDP